MKLGLQFRYQNGQVQVNHNHFLGYTKDADGNLIIDPEQAEVVKRIYRGIPGGLLYGSDCKKVWKQTAFSPALAKTKMVDQHHQQKILRNEKIHRRGPGKALAQANHRLGGPLHCGA